MQDLLLSEGKRFFDFFLRSYSQYHLFLILIFAYNLSKKPSACVGDKRVCVHVYEFVHVIYYKHINITCLHITHHSSTHHLYTNHPTTQSTNHSSTSVVSIEGKIVHNLSLTHNKMCHM
ncbi:hypothetical protein YC2023_048341 [Brassica napus]